MSEGLTYSEGIKLYTRVINSLHSQWEPHDTQELVGQALFRDDIRQIFIQCGRKWGKTEIVIYCLFRWAMLNPGSSCYYIAPYQKQAKEIVWASKRIQNFIDPKWIKSINNTELRLTLINDSFVKVDGSDNYEAYRGISPHFMIYDEFKDFRPEWHIAMEPNLLPNNSPLIIIGTPPEREGQYTRLAQEFKVHKKKSFFKFTSWDNPHNSREWLEDTKKSLYARGEGDVWEREYMANDVRGGASSLFPMLNDSIHRFSPEVLTKTMSRFRRRLQWYCIADPATASVFGVLFVAVNPHTKDIYILKEIYETQQAEMSVGRMMGQITNLIAELNWDSRLEFDYVCDEAAAWFMNEVEQGEDTVADWYPTQKAANKKDAGLSTIKDALLQGKIHISTDCPKLWWEMENYCKDKNGKIPKVDDHLIDCLRYFISANYYTLNDLEVSNPEKDEDFRGATLESDYPEMFDGEEGW